MSRKSAERRGVLMLLVLIILAIFVLLVLTYLLSSSESSRHATSAANASSGSGGDATQAQADLNRIARELTAGSTNLRSIFYTTSLLEKMWGEGGGRPYSGTGVAPTNDSNSIPYALQWNPRGWLVAPSFNTLDTNYVTALAGGMNVDYDAPDYRFPALTMIDENGVVLRPAFHDPWLVKYMQTQHASRWNAADNELKNRVLFRPNPAAHTNFDGSNAAFDPVVGPWDIDNDGDGNRDSVWIYTGDPVQTLSDGTQAVPLYAIMVVDLDSRLNVNLHSNGQLADAPNPPTGFGTGPAEISLHGVTADHADLLTTRYGADGPGSSDDPTATMHLWTQPLAMWMSTEESSYGSPHDVFGLGRVSLSGAGYPTYSALSDPANNPYRMNINTGIGDDEYTLAEMERALRETDIDAATLPPRLATKLNNAAHYTITTLSSDSTAPGGPFDATTIASEPRFAANQRIDLNLRFGDGLDNDSNGIVDEPGEAGGLVWWATGSGPSTPTGIDAYKGISLDTSYDRTKLATALFDVAMAVTPATCSLWADNNAKQLYLAQWVVNMIDFRDRDSIMTRFNYDTGDATKVVWGCEAPHLIISETICAHDRGTRDTTTATDVATPPDTLVTDATTPDIDYDQVRRPRGPLLVELKNRDSNGESLPAELYDSAGKLILGRTTPAGGSPVWRLAITVRAPANPTLDKPTLDDADVERAVYFIADPVASPPPLPTAPSLTYWADASSTAIGSGEYCTIGPDEISYFGTRTQGSPTTYPKSIDLDSLASGGHSVKVPPVIDSGTNNETRFSATEPVAGYVNDAEDGTGLYTTTIYDVPFDAADPDLEQYGTIDDYKTVHLQRLANPLIAWHATDNPYITVDSMPLAMTVYSGEEATPGSEAANVATVTALAAVKFDTRDRNGAGVNNIWKASYPVRSTGTVAAPLPNESISTADQRNASLVAPTGANMFPWLTWNNRPYLNKLELLNVPFSAPQKLLADHSTLGSGSPFTATNPTDGIFEHLPNLFNATATAADRSELQRLLEYVDVPSPFAGTRTYPQPTSPLHPSYYGQGIYGTNAFTKPGLVNINTLTEPVWTAILNGWGGPTFDELAASRQGYPDAQVAQYPTAIARPFRSYAGNANVPEGVSVPTLSGGGNLNAPEVEHTLLRSDGSGTPQPLFALDSTADGTNTTRNPYFRNQLHARLSSMLTTRSNVFAVWITVGFFEAEQVTPSASLPEGIKIGKEVGVNSNNIVRHRAFFIVDRSRSDYTTTPFTRGDQSQLGNVILLERPIE